MTAEQKEAAEKVADVLTDAYVNIIQPVFQTQPIHPDNLRPWLRQRVVTLIEAHSDVLG